VTAKRISLLVLAAALGVGLAAPSGASGFTNSIRTTSLLSRSYTGQIPNGPSRNAFVSADQRIARYVAYESDASDIVQGDTNNLTDVFVARRRKPWKKSGSPWLYGNTVLASKGLNGQPANGRSYRPTADGDSKHRASCVAFVSEASNLVPGDTNGVADAFVYHVGSHRIERVSVDSDGHQADGPTYDVSVDGECARVAFTADAPDLAYRGSHDGWKSATTNRAEPGKTQVYMRFLRGEANYKPFQGLTFLASASKSGHAGNGSSSDAQMDRKGNAIAFTSQATNLGGRDHGKQPDIYLRTIDRFIPRRSKTESHELLLRSKLISATRSGRPGNGPSTHPAINTEGRYIAFQSNATNLSEDHNGSESDVFSADMRTGRPNVRLVSRSDFGQGNGPSSRPAISAVGWFVVFDSEATNLRPSSHGPDMNGVRDVEMWYLRSNRASIESRDSDNQGLRYPSQNPSIGLHGNYVAFESVDPLIDVPLLEEHYPTLAKLANKVYDIAHDVLVLDRPNASGVKLNLAYVPNLLDPDVIAPDLGEAVAGKPEADPSLQQIYLRYIGPCARVVVENGRNRCLLR
jgi:hypothetical protein